MESENKDKNKKFIWIGIAAAVIAAALIIYFVFFFKNSNVKNAEAAISAIGTVSLESGELIDNADKLYEGLTNGEKNKVDNLDTLEAAKNEYEDLRNREAAKEADKLIAAIGEVERESEKKIKEAREAYEALTKTQKSYVENLEELEKAEEELKYIDVKECEELIDDIKNAADSPEIGLPIALSAARNAYDALSSSHKERVSNYDNLEAAEEAYEEYADKKDALKIQQEHAQRFEDIEEYCKSCQAITFAQLVSNPDTYEDKDVSITVEIEDIEDAAFLKSQSIIAKPQGGKDDNKISLVDKRDVKEPEFKEDMVLTVYGVFDGIDKDGMPEIKVNYTSEDDAEAINEKPTITEVLNYVEEGIEIAKDVTGILKAIPW